MLSIFSFIFYITIIKRNYKLCNSCTSKKQRFSVVNKKRYIYTFENSSFILYNFNFHIHSFFLKLMK